MSACISSILPGYGYAKVSKTVKGNLGRRWLKAICKDREQLKLTLMLVDSRMPPTESDTMMKQWLDHHGFQTQLF